MTSDHIAGFVADEMRRRDNNFPTEIAGIMEVLGKNPATPEGGTMQLFIALRLLERKAGKAGLLESVTRKMANPSWSQDTLAQLGRAITEPKNTVHTLSDAFSQQRQRTGLEEGATTYIYSHNNGLDVTMDMIAHQLQVDEVTACDEARRLRRTIDDAIRRRAERIQGAGI